MLQADAIALGTVHQWVVRVMEWEEIEAFWGPINEAFDRTEDLWSEHYDKSDILKELLDGTMHLVAAAKDDVVVLLTLCAVCTYPKGRRLEVFWMTGQGLEEAIPLIEQAMEQFARVTGCVAIDAYGRRGWERVGKRLGYRLARVQMTRTLHEGSVN